MKIRKINDSRVCHLREVLYRKQKVENAVAYKSSAILIWTAILALLVCLSTIVITAFGLEIIGQIAFGFVMLIIPLEATWDRVFLRTSSATQQAIECTIGEWAYFKVSHDLWIEWQNAVPKFKRHISFLELLEKQLSGDEQRSIRSQRLKAESFVRHWEPTIRQQIQNADEHAFLIVTNVRGDRSVLLPTGELLQTLEQVRAMIRIIEEDTAKMRKLVTPVHGGTLLLADFGPENELGDLSLADLEEGTLELAEPVPIKRDHDRDQGGEQH